MKSEGKVTFLQKVTKRLPVKLPMRYGILLYFCNIGNLVTIFCYILYSRSTHHTWIYTRKKGTLVNESKNPGKHDFSESVIGNLLKGYLGGDILD
jgi:hypothetical protein